MLKLRLLGTGSASYLGRSLPGFPSQLPYLLLCYLLLNRNRRHVREQLACVFWGDYSASASLKHLRNTLWRLRHLLEASGVHANNYLETADSLISFAPLGPYWLDVEAFEAKTLPHQGISGRDLGTEQVQSLQEAIDLYSGDLLDGVYEDWCLYDRERLHMLYLNTLSKLVSYHEHNGTYEQGLAYGKRILACDSTRESAHRQIMRLYWLMGDRNGALIQYKRCAQILNETMNTDPMEETRLLYRQIITEKLPTPRPLFAGGVAQGPGPDALEAKGPMDQALEALQYVQATLDEANAELRRISQLIQQLQPEQQDAGSHRIRRPRDVY
jgi:DNA-binding SARP family transcriptional activator